MASKSVGQIAGTVIGAAVGFFAGGNVALGASIGGMIGGMIDPPKGPTVVGPRLDDLSFQTSTLGAPLGRAYGTVPVLGNVVWLEGDKYREVITSEEQGGKGGSTSTYETAHYYATFAVSLLRVTDATKTVALRRLWIGSNLVYDAGSDDIGSIIASNTESLLFDFYSGTDDQQPNTRWQADKGANAVSGFPGRCYIVIYDLDLEPYSRSLAMAQVKAELTVGSPTASSVVIEDICPLSDGSLYYKMGSVRFTNSSVQTCTLKQHISNADWNSIRVDQVAEIGVEHAQMLSNTACAAWEDVSFSTKVPLLVTQSDIDCAPFIRYRLGNTSTRFVVFDGSGNEIVNTGEVAQAVLPYEPYDVAADGGAYYLVKNGQKIYIVSGNTVVQSSSATTNAWAFGLSDNYLFGVHYTSSISASCTVYKYDRATLALVDTYTQSCNGQYAQIHVAGDGLFYTMAPSDGKIWAWSDGVATDTGLSFGAAPIGGTDRDYFRVVSKNLAYALRDSGSPTPTWQLRAAYLKYAANTASLRNIVTSECALSGVGSAEIDLDELTDSTVRGYKISSAAAVRSSLEMLQAAYPFDVAPSGYKLRFVSRGGASLATIPESDLGAVAGGDSFPVLLPMSREMDTQIPYKVSVRYLDPAREYDIGEQYASRPDTASVSERTVELSLVLTGDEAAQAADVLNQKDWLERVSFGPFSLPPTWRNLEPPDVVTIEHRGQSHSVRLTRAETLPDGRIVCSAAPSVAQSYTSTALAQNPLTIGQSVLPLKGSTSDYLLDIPRIRSEQDVPGMVFGLLGKSTGWPGGVLLRSDDSGNTWPVCGAMNTRANVFQASEAMAVHHGYSIDVSSVLTVTPVTPDAALSSLTETQLYAHGNIAAYGADGRWEIIAFKTVTDNTGTYTLKDFLRGLYGTEQNTSLHAAGDLIVMLDTATVGFFGLPVNAIGSPRPYRAVTQGAAIDSAADEIDTYDANNLKPLAPVDLRGSRNSSTFDWTVEFTRRTRWPVEVFSGATVPLGETSELYEVEFWDATYTTLKRTVSGLTTPSCPYSSVNQIADFGATQPTLYPKARQVSSVAGRGHALAQAITRILPTASDYRVVGLHFDGSNGATSTTEEKGRTVSFFGNAQISTARYKWVSSLLLDGTGDYISIPHHADLNLSSGDWIIRGWIWVVALTAGTMDIINKDGVSGSSYSQYTMGINSAGKLTGFVGNGNGVSPTGTNYTGTTTVTTGALHYVEMTNVAGIVYLWLDGALEASAAKAAMYDGGKSLLLGYQTGQPASSYFNGNLEDFEVVKGFGGHTSPYSVPTAPF